jgi:hypothetical protein
VSIGSPNPSGGLFLSPDQKGGDKDTKHPFIELFGGLVVLQIRARFASTLYHPFRDKKAIGGNYVYSKSG